MPCYRDFLGLRQAESVESYLDFFGASVATHRITTSRLGFFGPIARLAIIVHLIDCFELPGCSKRFPSSRLAWLEPKWNLTPESREPFAGRKNSFGSHCQQQLLNKRYATTPWPPIN